MRKAFSTLLLTFHFPFKLLRKTKIDNFVGGLIFGAVFSLVVNIATVKSQEIINRQRALETLEREITYHIITMNGMYSSENEIYSMGDEQYINIDLLMASRLETRVWDNTDTLKYISELDPDAAAKISTYYDVVISSVNRILDDNSRIYKEMYKNCEPFYQIITTEERRDKEYCNQIARMSASTHVYTLDIVKDPLSEILDIFHPTQDRLDNFFLKAMMGDNSVEILKRANIDLDTKAEAS